MKGAGGSRILSICDDEHLAWSRRLVLENAGLEVESCDSETALIECQAKSFHVAILCHSIPHTQKCALTKELRRLFPDIQIIGHICPSEVPDPAWDLECDVCDGPAGLVQAVESLLSSQKFPLKEGRRHP